MFTQKNFRIGFLLLAGIVALLAEPVVAAKTRKKAAKPALNKGLTALRGPKTIAKTTGKGPVNNKLPRPKLTAISTTVTSLAQSAPPKKQSRRMAKKALKRKTRTLGQTTARLAQNRSKSALGVKRATKGVKPDRQAIRLRGPVHKQTPVVTRKRAGNPARRAPKATKTVISKTRTVVAVPKVVVKRPATRVRKTVDQSKTLKRVVKKRITTGARGRQAVRGHRRGGTRVGGITDDKAVVVNNTTTLVRSEPVHSGSSDRHIRRDKHRRRDRSRLSINLNLGSYGTRDVLRHRHHRRRLSRHSGRRIFHRIVWPSYRHIIYYGNGPFWSLRWAYPYYHRKHVFVSLGGYWPVGYRYRRYYWYSYYPYYWYGYDPVAYHLGGDAYNYYTYNYYGDDSGRLQPGQVVNGVEIPDYDALSAVREKLEEETVEGPEEETQADRLFDEGVKAFEAGDYPSAVDRFDEARQLEPDDVVLPFAYVQALFADEQYAEAVEVLREALSEVKPQEEGVFYPRGLYGDEKVLNEQIDRLAEAAQDELFDYDLQVLLGYQLLGVGRFDEAAEHLENAEADLDNRQAATLLLGLLEKLKNAEQTQPTEL